MKHKVLSTENANKTDTRQQHTKPRKKRSSQLPLSWQATNAILPSRQRCRHRDHDTSINNTFERRSPTEMVYPVDPSETSTDTTTVAAPPNKATTAKLTVDLTTQTTVADESFHQENTIERKNNLNPTFLPKRQRPAPMSVLSASQGRR